LPPGKSFEALAPKTSRILHPGSLDASRVSLWIPNTPAAVWNDGESKADAVSTPASSEAS